MKQHNSCFNETKQNNEQNFIQTLKEWSKKNETTILFDSDKNGWDKNEFQNIILYKKNLYFIILDEQNDVFGGYLNSTVNEISSIKDAHSFVFSIMNNSNHILEKYPIQKAFQKFAFHLTPDEDKLFTFGKLDIVASSRNLRSFSISYGFYYYKPNDDVSNNSFSKFPNKFTICRLLVVEMN